MNPADTRERVLRALRAGPVYEPYLALIVGCPESDVRVAINHLARAGKVKRDAGNSVRLAA